MKRHLVVIWLLLLGSLWANAQSKFYPARPRYYGSQGNHLAYGFKVGVEAPRLYYTHPHLNGLPQDLMLTPSASVFVEIPFHKTWAVLPELNYQQRGGATSYLFDNAYQETYQLQAHYVSFRLPIRRYFPVFDLVNPYVFVAPDMGWALAGKISLTNPDQEWSVGINDANMNRFYIGALGGAGLRFVIPLVDVSLVVSTDVGLNLGFLDTYSSLEHEGTSHPINVYAYSIKDRRLSRGLEMHLGLSFFVNDRGACGRF